MERETGIEAATFSLGNRRSVETMNIAFPDISFWQ